MRRFLLAMMLGVMIVPAHAQIDENGRYDIMRPEPGVPPKYKPPRGSTEHVVIPPSISVPPPSGAVPPPLYVPQTGQSLPNLPMIGSGPGGRETSQDRAVRCAHQAGVYGQAAGDRNAYVGSCINQ